MKRIGITGNFFLPSRTGAPSPFGAHYLNHEYFQALEDLGALPWFLPRTRRRDFLLYWLDSVDSLILTGGFDVPADFFGEKEKYPEFCTLDRPRVEYELELLREAEIREKKILGICLGMQIFNVYRGGSLYQHLPAQKPLVHSHSLSSQEPRALAHFVEIEPGSLLNRVVKETRMVVNSMHHQAVKTPGQRLLVNALSEGDSVIEGLESDDGRFLGVQWHPESLQHFLKPHRSLFDWIIEE